MTDIDEKVWRERLVEIFAFRWGEEIVSISRHDAQRGSDKNPTYVMEYRMQLTNGAVVNFGTAAELLSFRKAQAAFAESFGHVIPSKEARNWDDSAQLIFDLERIQRTGRVIQKPAGLPNAEA